MQNKLIVKLSIYVIAIFLIVPGLFSCAPVGADDGVFPDLNEPDMSVDIVNQPGNNSPVIDQIIPEWTSVARGTATKIKIIAHDPDGDTLVYSWRCTRGKISGKGSEITYSAPTGYIDNNPIEVYVSDGRGGGEISSINMPVVCCSHAQKNPDWAP
jgi:hypothetical protein